MKKYLSALAVIGSFAIASVASAFSMPELELSGRSEIFAGWRNQPTAFNGTYVPTYIFDQDLDLTIPEPYNPNSLRRTRNNIIVSDNILDLKAKGTFWEEHKMEYGGLVRVHFNTSDATNKESTVADKAMAYLQHDKIGRLEYGTYPSAGGMIESDIASRAAAAYGIDGYWSQWFQDAAFVDFAPLGFPGNIPIPGAAGFKYLLTPNLPSNYSGFYYSDAPKLNFYTKPYPNLLVGISYTPDLDDAGTIEAITWKDGAPSDSQRRPMNLRDTFDNIVNAGLQYDYDINCNTKLRLNLSGEVGQSKRDSFTAAFTSTGNLKDLRAYEVGGLLFYDDYTFGASYGDWGKTGTVPIAIPGAKRGTKYFTLLGAGKNGKLDYSVSYMHSKRAGGVESLTERINLAFGLPSNGLPLTENSYNKFETLSIGTGYKLFEGFMPYAELTMFKGSSATDVVKNKGYILFLATRIRF